MHTEFLEPRSTLLSVMVAVFEIQVPLYNATPYDETQVFVHRENYNFIAN